MEEKIKNILANEPELLQYYYNNADKINDLIHKFNISIEEVKNLILLLNLLDQQEIADRDRT